jgi:hypothetical protein
VSILIPGAFESSSSDDYPIYARSGWLIPQEKPDRVDPRIMQNHAKELMRWRPNIILRSLSNYPYNCVGMIFASRRAWIEIDYVYKILIEDEYRQIQRNEVRQGDVVLYKDETGEPSHVALIMMLDRIGQHLSIQVMSKWGNDPEFVHFEENVPSLLGVPTEYWTDRSIT